MTTSRMKLDLLHADFLREPPTPKRVAKALADYVQAQDAAAKADHQLSLLMVKQRKLAQEAEAMRLRVRSMHENVQAVREQRDHHLREVDSACEELLRTHGKVPIEVDGITYDFGCWQERVYLVPRVKPRKRMKMRSGK